MKTNTNNTQTHLFKTTWNADSLWNVLSKNDAQLVKALHRLYDYQTRTEKIDRETKYFNKVGFNGTDGKFMSSLATFHKRFGYLSSKQMFCLRKRMKKYAGQLAKIANGELVVPDEPKPFKKNDFKIRGRRSPLGFSNWSRPRVEAPALNESEIEYETGNLVEHCRQESGGLTGKPLKDYINRHYGHN